VVKVGDVLADGPSCDMGELALGRNVLVAFMPWQGYNFEDSILVSERIAKDDVFTSMHIEEFECVARDTKLGKEEITRDIPNVGEEALKDLDDSGIVRIGAEVKPRRHPRRQDHPEGRDPALPRREAAPRDLRREGRRRARQLAQGAPGRRGIVINARVFSRKGTEKDDRARDIEDQERARIERTRDEEVKILRDSFYRRVKEILLGQTTTGKLVDDKGKVLLQKGVVIDEPRSNEIPRKYWGEIPVTDVDRVQKMLRDLDDLIRTREEHFRDKIEKLSRATSSRPASSRW
jgi:DNA-directed RNA polymerase subunit beta